LWNIFFPVQVPAGAAETHFDGSNDSSGSKFNVRADDTTVTIFDAMRRHRGMGNETRQDRVMLHLVFVTEWLINDPYGRKELQEQFNSNEDIDDESTQVGYWLAQMKGD
jgi:hypothetical protein